jgi:hypothetical protein
VDANHRDGRSSVRPALIVIVDCYRASSDFERAGGSAVPDAEYERVWLKPVIKVTALK